MASSSDWIVQAGKASADEARKTTPGWITALGLGEADQPLGFCEASPFEPPHCEPEPDGDESVSSDEEAFMRGFAEGHAEAARERAEAMAAEQSRLRDLRLNFRALDEAAMDALAQDLSATVQALCEQVLGEYAADAKALAQRCHAAARRLGSGPRDLTLTLHPETIERIDAENFPGWTLETDPALALGELRLSGPQGSVRDGPQDWRRAFAEALGA